MRDSQSEFRDAIAAAGLNPPASIQPGKMHRLPGLGKKNGNTAGWCILFKDLQGGCFGDWSSDLGRQTWQAAREVPLSNHERAQFAQQVKDAQARAESDRQARENEVSQKAAKTWNNSQPAPDNHPYLKNKNVAGFGIRFYQGSLVIPVRDGSQLMSLQFIDPDGNKRFLKGGKTEGGYFAIGDITKASTLCVAEGFATGATVHEATNQPVAIAFNANNLVPVVEKLRERHPTLRIVIAADDDHLTDGNPGRTKAAAAARLVDALVAVPDFGPSRPPQATDFNDMASLLDLEAVARAIENATPPTDPPWPEPQPLVGDSPSLRYPQEALPKGIQDAVAEVQQFTQAPVPLVAASALAALSIAIQGHFDIQRAEMLEGPTSLFLLTIADSGERKSTCDRFFTQPIRDFEKRQLEARKSDIARYQAAREAWEARRGGLKDKIRQLAKEGKPTGKHESHLQELEYDKPEPPKVPSLIYGDFTPEALAHSLATKWPSAGVVSAESGLVFGSHGMGKDSAMRNMSQLNVLWDGGDLKIDRRTSESFTLQGARLTMALQVQEPTLRNFFDRNGDLARGSGFMARFLIACPESTQGIRKFSEPPSSWPALSAFEARVSAILEKELTFTPEGVLKPRVLGLSDEAKRCWVEFHDEVESLLGKGGDLHEIRDVASKIADNAARLAALFQVFECPDEAVGLKALQAAVNVALWHLNEAKRFFGSISVPREAAEAIQLNDWLISWCQRENTSVVPRRDIQRNVIPSHLRKKEALDSALRELIEADRVRVIKKNKRVDVHLNPALLAGGAS